MAVLPRRALGKIRQRAPLWAEASAQLLFPPSMLFGRQLSLSIDPDEELVVDTIKALGDENIVISTDWPHGDSSFPQALNTFLKIDGVSDQSRRKILWDNCARLYNLRD